MQAAHCDQSSATNSSTVISTVRIIALRVPRSSVGCIRNGDRIATLADQADVTALLPYLPVSEFMKRLNTIVSRDGRYTA